MAKLYYTLVSRDKLPGARWGIEFGDYDRSVVVQEREDLKDEVSRIPGMPEAEYQILKTLESQKEIDKAINELNNKL